MATIQFIPATREAIYSRTCVYGPGGSGKTLTGLMTLHTLCKGERFAVIDTERGRTRKYVSANPWGLDWKFDIWTPYSFDPASLTEALGVAAGAGYPGVMIDSGSQYWNGVDGMIEQVDRKAAEAGRKDTFSSGWREMNPIERRMWDAIMSYPGHIWMTLRVKTDYVIEEKERGNRVVSVPRKVGLKPVQRDNFEFEFDLVLEADQECTFTVTKSDILIIPQGTVIPKPGTEFAENLGEFCAEGSEATGVMAYRDRALDPAATLESLKELHDTIEGAGLKHAPCTDEFERPTVLGDLVIARARAMRVAREQAARAQRAAQTSTKPEPAAATATSDGATSATASNNTVAEAVGSSPSRNQRERITNQIVAAGISGDQTLLIVSELIGRHVHSWDEVTTAEGSSVFNQIAANAKGSKTAKVFLANLVENPTVTAPAGEAQLS